MPFFFGGAGVSFFIFNVFKVDFVLKPVHFAPTILGTVAAPN